MLQVLWVAVALAQPKVYTINIVSLFTKPDHEVCWLDVSVNQVSGMQSIHSLQELICELQDSLQRKAPTTLVEQVLQRRTQEVHDHDIVIVLLSKIVYACEAMTRSDLTINFVLVSQLRTSGGMTLEFYSDLRVSK